MKEKSKRQGKYGQNKEQAKQVKAQEKLEAERIRLKELENKLEEQKKQHSERALQTAKQDVRGPSARRMTLQKG
jgi:hypothetical protein